MINKLHWDSDFFNLKIGRVDIQKRTDLDIFLSSETKNYDLIYVFSKEELTWDISLIDVKITFEKKTQIYNNNNNNNSIVEFDSIKHSFPQLLNLVYLSGHDSRFFRDPIFGEENFKRLYKKWIENSIHDKYIKVLVYFEENINTILGFVTVDTSRPILSIGLIAVSDSAQNLGVGRQLVRAAESQFNSDSIIHVATQRSNTKACRFYEKVGFIKKNTDYIYHYVINPI